MRTHDGQLERDEPLARAVRAIAEADVPAGPAPEVLAATLERVRSRRRGTASGRKRRVRALARWLAAAAAVAVLLGGLLRLRPDGEGYAWADTVAAAKGVRHVHLIDRDPDGTRRDERWIEYAVTGERVRYRQDTPGHLLVIDDGRTVMAHYRDRDTVVLWDAEDKRFTFIDSWQEFLVDLASRGGTMTIERNVTYRGRPAHRVSWLKFSEEVYVDPDTRLPVGLLGYEVSYEAPPEGRFEVRLPEGATVVDRRGDEPSDEKPSWLRQRDRSVALFTEARRRLEAGHNSEALGLLSRALELEPRRNWAWYWRGVARHRLGRYEEAARDFSRVIEMLAEYSRPGYCYLARGRALRRLGREEAARRDFAVALPDMIVALRHPRACYMFDYAEDPTRSRCRELADRERVSRMVERLREVTGESFGYDPGASPRDNEAAISAWEQWWREDADAFRDREPE